MLIVFDELVAKLEPTEGVASLTSFDEVLPPPEPSEMVIESMVNKGNDE
jgi:hypothetical protein